MSRILAILFSLLSGSFPSYGQSFDPGITYTDPTGFVEYRTGNLPIILSAPHGGSISPDSIPTRACNGCVTAKDSWTREIAEGLYEEIHEQTGCYPHLVLNLLHRRKFDANRDIGDAADGNLLIEQAWTSYHEFIDSAKSQVIGQYGKGLFLDLHGHAHTIQRIELGYLLSSSELRMVDSTLNTTELLQKSSIRTLAGQNLQSLFHAELLRGPLSMGTILEGKGFPSVPSLYDPYPLVGESYFTGGYNTQRHGSRDNNGPIDAIQIEMNQTIRFNDSTREVLIDSLAEASLEFVALHYVSGFRDQVCQMSSTNLDREKEKFSVKIFPNPASDELVIVTNHPFGNIRILNGMGQIVLQQDWQGERINISHLPPGGYVILYRAPDQQTTLTKFIKQW